MMGQGHGVAPQMGDVTDSQASVDKPSNVSAGTPVQTPRRSVFRDVPWRWSDMLLAFAPFVLFRAAALFFDVRSSLAAVFRQLWILLFLLIEAWMLLVPLWIARTRNVYPARLPRPRAVIVEVLFALLVLPVVCAVTVAVPPVLVHLLGATDPPVVPWAPLAGSFNRIEWLIFIVLAVMLAPIAEETFFRGFFYNALRQRLHPILAATIQAAVFGYAHPFSLAHSIAIGMLALALALVYEWRKTLLAPVLLHAAVNSAGIIVLALSLAPDANAPRLGLVGEASQGGCTITEVVPGSALEPGRVP